MGAQAANAVSLLVTAVANTAVNRRVTFGIRGRAQAGRHQVRGLIAFGIGLALTSGALAVLHHADARPGPRRRGQRAGRGQPPGHHHPVRPLPQLGVPRRLTSSEQELPNYPGTVLQPGCLTHPIGAIQRLPSRPARRARRRRRANPGLARVLRARPDDPAWARPALLALLVATGLLYLAA